MFEFIFLLWTLSFLLAYVVYNDAKTNPTIGRTPAFWFIVVGLFPALGLILYMLESGSGGRTTSPDGGKVPNQKSVTVLVSGDVKRQDGKQTRVEMKVNTNNVYEATTIFRDSCINDGYEPIGNPSLTIDSIQT
ncbi:hypothetical protein [Natrinema sp. 1APR25-10V2]|uniref:hypothetical protein n=1 Tax=Natrinema sp. 1APR25-10V2 TaxID=2951081 RepID=UPI002874FA74|nr:hypothetical protein [Natrinema sp. 1APR25-10V2]MDS0478562.1 hypothetical protein [Natrinema sp. 1APR25-10V2]